MYLFLERMDTFRSRIPHVFRTHVYANCNPWHNELLLQSIWRL